MRHFTLLLALSLSLTVLSACADDPEISLEDSGTSTGEQRTEGSSSDGRDASEVSPSDEASDGQASRAQAPGEEVDDEPSRSAPEASRDAPTRPDPTYGLSTQLVWHAGITREYLLFVPSSYTGEESFPLVLNFHGGSGDATSQQWTSDMRDLSQEEGFLLVYPQGEELDGGTTHWNPIPPSAESKSTTDDFGFVAALIDQMAENYNVDEERVYATGYSNGAGMSYGLLCYLSDRIAAAAPVSGSMYVLMSEECQATQPKALAIFNGTEDGERPYDGLDGWFLPVETALDYWLNHNGINASPVLETFSAQGFTMERRLYTGGSANVVLFKAIGGGHDWFDFNIEGANIDRIIWDFLSAHDMEGLR